MVELKCIILCFLFAICQASHETPDQARLPKPNEPSEKPKNPLARGWGDHIEWVELEAGIEIAKEKRKPLLLLIHKTWCGACQSLKGKFAKAKTIADLAKSFVMVNAEDDEEPWEEEYYPDGGKYIPRILFLSPDGEVLKDVVNPKEEYKQYPYYYSNPGPIIHSMQNVLKRFEPGKETVSKKKDIKKDESEEPKIVKADKQTKEEARVNEEKEDKSKKEKESKGLPRKEKGKRRSSESEEASEEKPRQPAKKPQKKEL